MKRIVIANWKMNLNLAEALALANSTVKVAETHQSLSVVIAPSLPWLISIRETIRWMPPNFALASQVVSPWSEGAYTGDISASQLKGLVQYCLVGHSERRRYHHEKGITVSEQATQLLENAITPVICFGEMTQSVQRAFSPQITLDLSQDLSSLSSEDIGRCIFAYEPLWAIGTGNPAHPEYVKKTIRHVKMWAEETYHISMPILYGGSVTERNAQVLGKLEELDGLLVGGASLHARQFDRICSLFRSPL